MKEFYLQELKKRNLPTFGTFRVLQNRYQTAVLNEAVPSEPIVQDVRETNSENASESNLKNVSESKFADLSDNPLDDINNFDVLFDLPSEDSEMESEEDDLKDEDFQDDESVVILEETDFETTPEIEALKEEIENNKQEKLHKLFVGNLPFSYTEADIRREFANYEPILDVTLPGTKSKGYAFIIFQDATKALEALAQMNGRTVGGREIRVERGRRETKKPKKKKAKKNRSKKKKSKPKKKQPSKKKSHALSLDVRKAPTSKKSMKKTTGEASNSTKKTGNPKMSSIKKSSTNFHFYLFSREKTCW